jgi:hypothetical protein
MRQFIKTTGLFATVLAGGLAAGCCGHSASDRSTADGQVRDAQPARDAGAREAQKMKTDGQSLKAQGDETGGQRLIDQAKIKQSQPPGAESGAGPATQPKP